MHNATRISPSTTMSILEKVEKAIWNRCSSYKNVMRYIRRWHQEEYDNRGNYCGDNFTIMTQMNNDNIDLSATLDGMSDELLFQIAVDLNVEVPGLIYSVAEIKGLLADKYENAANTFEKAYQKIYTEPASAILMANSALERIIKKICSDGAIEGHKSKDTLYKLTSNILKQFSFFPDSNLNTNIRNIGSGLLSASQAIENLRSNHTDAHGTEDEVIADPLYAMLVVNSVSTIGLFLLGYYEKHYQLAQNNDDEIPF